MIAGPRLPPLWLGCWFSAALVLPGPGSGQTPPASRPYVATPQRPTFTTDTSTAAPGTVELEYGGSTNGKTGQAPVSIKFAPDGRGPLANSEFRLSFEAIDFASVPPRGTTRHFGDRFVFGYRRKVFNKHGLSVALAPRFSVLRRSNQGVRAGITGIAAKGFGRYTLVQNLSLSGATSPSQSNPQRLIESDTDVSRALGSDGFRSRLSVFAGLHLDKARSQGMGLSLGQGLAFRLRPNVVLDAAIRELNLRHSNADYQILFGMTANLGRLFPR